MSNDNKITLQQLINSVYEIYFQPLPCPMNAFWRFLNAFLGAISIFGTSLYFHFEFVSEFIKDVLDPSASKIFFFMLLLFASIISVFFALLVSFAKTKHGPIRIYLSGLLLSAFVVFVVRATWIVN